MISDLQNPVIPAAAGIHCPAGTNKKMSATQWIPAFAGMTKVLNLFPQLTTNINFYLSQQK